MTFPLHVRFRCNLFTSWWFPAARFLKHALAGCNNSTLSLLFYFFHIFSLPRAQALLMFCCTRISIFSDNEGENNVLCGCTHILWIIIYFPPHRLLLLVQLTFYFSSIAAWLFFFPVAFNTAIAVRPTSIFCNLLDT